ncbi:MAG: hypothetical protein ACJ74U_18155 [Jatrophihabitantaceae bacterium]
MKPIAVLRLTVALTISLALGACVGPARTTSAYNGKAVQAADSALSEVQTVRLTVRLSLAGKLQQAYLETVLTNSETAIASVQNSFDSIQPPDTDTADKLRSDLDQQLSDGSDTISQLRIAARRQDTDQLRSLLASLDPVASKLQAFSSEHGG